MKAVHRRSSGARARAGERAQLRIDALAAGGAGIGRLAGEVVFVPATAPGDLVEVELDRSARPARGRLLRVVEPSADRIAPPCRFAETCGGCDWMHVRVEAQQAAHAQIVRQAIARAASLAEADLPPLRLHPAPQPLGYRSRARLFARAERGEVRVGYRAPRTHAVAAVDRCLVLADPIAPLAGELPGVLRGAAGEGDILVSLGASSRPVVEILWRGQLPPAVWQLLDERTARGAWAGARVTLDGAREAASFGDPRPAVVGADGLPLVLAPGGFGQPSEEGAAVLAGRAAELAHLDSSRPPHVLELFAGSGTLSVLLARGAPRPAQSAEVASPAAPGLASFTAVERAPEAVACLRQNLAARGLAGKAIEADADQVPIPARTDVVVLDPPRGGAPGAARAIAASGARVVVYVSCDPATLGRDLGGILRGGFEITDIEAVELFPQTSHIESIVRLTRARRPAR
ncbi:MULTISPECIES: class I SAM-dependent RNA methyltransferase [Sorangium]|uniref:SAM-dependent methyltransferase n=1 Tax=Sorangium cellulosum TaxID=56 RepID=A0A4P2R144_SORCE|nr:MULTISPECIES: class I SAM-dependent RNA methyltransferase [Sorangium]AUX36575.1 SAM-dependent methyltransferase [Sorangium cellulosum]WCQ95873.1 23S rRNA (uracil-C(5))-methyltransferase RlmCD [Sorangium sp. Soce836]